MKPFKAATKNILSRWIKNLRLAGTDIILYVLQATRTPKYFDELRQAKRIKWNQLKDAGWRSFRTFAHFYGKLEMEAEFLNSTLRC